MPLSDRLNYQVGDQVRDRTSGQQGRVARLESLPGDFVLLTVVLTGGPLALHRVQEKLKRGQVSGGRFEKAVPEPFASTPSPAILRAEGGVTSAQAEFQAREQPNRRPTWGSAPPGFFRDPDTGRLLALATKHPVAPDIRYGWELVGKQWQDLVSKSGLPPAVAAKYAPQPLIPGGMRNFAPTVHPSDYGRGIVSRLDTIRELRQRARASTRDLDELLKYLEQPGRRLDNGSWTGSYFSDTRSGAAGKREALRRLLEATPTTTEVRVQFGGSSARNYLELLGELEAQSTTATLAGQAGLFRDLAKRLTSSFRSTSPAFQRAQRKLQLLGRRENYYRSVLPLTQDAVGGGRYEFTADSVESAFLPYRDYGLESGAAGAEEFLGTPRVGIDVELLHQHRARAGARAARFRDVTAGSDPYFVFRGDKQRYASLGKVVMRGGLPYRIADLAEDVGFNVRLEPLGSPTALFSPFPLDSPAWLDELVARANQLDPLLPEVPAVRAPATSIRLRGLLPGGIPGIRDAPVAFLTQFLAGEVSVKEWANDPAFLKGMGFQSSPGLIDKAVNQQAAAASRGFHELLGLNWKELERLNPQHDAQDVRGIITQLIQEELSDPEKALSTYHSRSFPDLRKRVAKAVRARLPEKLREGRLVPVEERLGGSSRNRPDGTSRFLEDEAHRSVRYGETVYFQQGGGKLPARNRASAVDLGTEVRLVDKAPVVGVAASTLPPDVQAQLLAADRQRGAFQIPKGQELKYSRALDQLLATVERYGPEVLEPELQHQVVQVGERWALKLRDQEQGGRDLRYFAGGKVQAANDPNLVFSLGRDVLDLPAKQARLTEHVLKQARREGGAILKAHRDAALAGTASPNTRTGIFQSQSGVTFGFHSKMGIQAEDVFARTQALLDADSYIGLDIETSRDEVREIQNLRLSLRRRHGDKFRVDESRDYTTLEFLRKKGARRLGTSQLSDEQMILDRAAQFLSSRKDEIVAGHNLSFDVTALIERAQHHGMQKEQAIFERVAQQQLADTMLLARAAFPHTPALGLESLAQNELGLRGPGGTPFVEEHIAAPDEHLANQLFEQTRKSELTRKNLAGIRELELQPGELVWKRPGRNLQDPLAGRAFRVEGILNPEQAKAAARAYQQAQGLSADAGDYFGMVLRPLSFTGGLEDASRIEAFATPHGFAQGLLGQYDRGLTETAARDQMERRAADLARRRIRRVLRASHANRGQEHSFLNVLKEAGRQRLVDKVESGMSPELALRSVQEGLGDDWLDRKLSHGLQSYADQFLGDSRIHRQLQLERPFFQGEFAQHQPVVEHLTEFVRQTGASADPLAGRVWADYIEKTRQLGDFAHLSNVEIAQAERQLSFRLPEIGRVALELGSPERLQTSVENVAAKLYRHLPAAELEAIAGKDELAYLRQLMQQRGTERVPFEESTGQRLLQSLWAQKIQPQLAETGFFRVEGTPAGRYRLQSQGLGDALRELMTPEAQAAAQAFAPRIPDELQPRTLEAETLHQLQQEYLEEHPADLAARLRKLALTLEPEHGQPGWVGQTIPQLAQGMARAAPEQQSEFLTDLRKATRRMSGWERVLAEEALAGESQEWAKTVFRAESEGRKLVTGRAVISPASERAFRPGKVSTTFMELAERLAANRNVGKSAAYAAGSAAGAALLFGIFHRPPAPPTPEAEGFESSETQRERRRTKTVREQAVPLKASITVQGEDPNGIGDEELTQSVHAALGRLMGKELGHHVSGNDRRVQMNRQYLDQVAGELMTHASR